MTTRLGREPISVTSNAWEVLILGPPPPATWPEGSRMEELTCTETSAPFV